MRTALVVAGLGLAASATWAGDPIQALPPAADGQGDTIAACQRRPAEADALLALTVDAQAVATRNDNSAPTSFEAAEPAWAAPPRPRRHGAQTVSDATQALLQQLLAQIDLGRLRLERDRQSDAAWSLGIEGHGRVRWAADLYRDERSRRWWSAGVAWPVASGLSARLALARRLQSPAAPQLTLSLKIDY
jgi:hypothetical protein